MTLKIHETVASLRKSAGMTQEELAVRLGVTNQAVSKWESAQCCPDISLLPELSKLFGVTVGVLLGCEAASQKQESEPIDALLGELDSLPGDAAAALAFRTAAAIHAAIVSKQMCASGANPGWNREDAVKHAMRGEWGYSVLHEPMLSTTMRQSTVSFSDNKPISIPHEDAERIVQLAKIFSDTTNLLTANALHALCAYSEDIFVSCEAIAARAGLEKELVYERLCGVLSEVVSEKDGKYRFKGKYMNLVPTLSLLDVK